MGTIMLVMKCLILGFAVESSFASFEMMIHISIWHIIIFKLWAINYSNQNSQHRLRGEIAQIWLVMIEFASRQLSEDSKILNRGVDWRSVPKSMCQESKVIPETPACCSKQVSLGIGLTLLICWLKCLIVFDSLVAIASSTSFFFRRSNSNPHCCSWNINEQHVRYALCAKFSWMKARNVGFDTYYRRKFGS